MYGSLLCKSSFDPFPPPAKRFASRRRLRSRIASPSFTKRSVISSSFLKNPSPYLLLMSANHFAASSSVRNFIALSPLTRLPLIPPRLYLCMYVTYVRRWRRHSCLRRRDSSRRFFPPALCGSARTSGSLTPPVSQNPAFRRKLFHPEWVPEPKTIFRSPHRSHSSRKKIKNTSISHSSNHLQAISRLKIPPRRSQPPSP